MCLCWLACRFSGLFTERSRNIAFDWNRDSKHTPIRIIIIIGIHFHGWLCAAIVAPYWFNHFGNADMWYISSTNKNDSHLKLLQRLIYAVNCARMLAGVTATNPMYSSLETIKKCHLCYMYFHFVCSFIQQGLYHRCVNARLWCDSDQIEMNKLLIDLFISYNNGHSNHFDRDFPPWTRHEWSSRPSRNPIYFGW